MFSSALASGWCTAEVLWSWSGLVTDWRAPSRAMAQIQLQQLVTARPGGVCGIRPERPSPNGEALGILHFANMSNPSLNCAGRDSCLPATRLLAQAAGELNFQSVVHSSAYERSVFSIDEEVQDVFLNQNAAEQRAGGLERQRNGAPPGIPKGDALAGQQLCTAPDSAGRVRQGLH